MKTVKSMIVAVVLAGAVAVQAEARDRDVNGLADGGSGFARPAVFLPPPPPPPNIVFDFGGRGDYRPYRPERCRDIVTVQCRFGRCREVVRTECGDRWRHRDWHDRPYYWRDHRRWHGDDRWHHDRWRDDRWREDRWRDRPYPRDRW